MDESDEGLAKALRVSRHIIDALLVNAEIGKSNGHG